MKAIARVLLIVAAAAMAVGCATLPPPERADTLLVIPVKTGPGSHGLAYEFLLRGSDAVRLPVSPQNGVYYFDKLLPGDYTIDRVLVTVAASAGGTNLIGGAVTERVSPQSFKLLAGSITILGATVMVTSEVTGPNRFTQHWKWIPTNRDEVLAELAKYDNFDRWKVAP